MLEADHCDQFLLHLDFHLNSLWFTLLYSQGAVGNGDDHAVSRLSLLLHLSIELLIQGFPSVCCGALRLGWGMSKFKEMAEKVQGDSERTEEGNMHGDI